MIRSASKRGSWYTSDNSKLKKQIEERFNSLKATQTDVKSLIVPHAGYVYSLNTALTGYFNINVNRYKTVFVIGVDHFSCSKKCSIPICDEYESSFRNFKLNKEIINSLPNFLFENRELKIDEKEHSVEIQVPILSYLFKDKKDVNLVPITVGGVSNNDMDIIAEVLKEHYVKDDVLFVISSDFCHWGFNFDYYRFNPTEYEMERNDDVNEYIKHLDMEATGYILDNKIKELEEYIERKSNTICGLNPIYLLMKIRKLMKVLDKGKLFEYSRSSKIKNNTDSSVGYASIGFFV